MPKINTLILLAASVFLSLLVSLLVTYALFSKTPKVATIDLQKLILEDQERFIALVGQGGMSEEQRALAEKSSMMFAKKLSITVDALGKECRCVLINKAALLGGEVHDYTDIVRQRLKS